MSHRFSLLILFLSTKLSAFQWFEYLFPDYFVKTQYSILIYKYLAIYIKYLEGKGYVLLPPLFSYLENSKNTPVTIRAQVIPYSEQRTHNKIQLFPSKLSTSTN